MARKTVKQFASEKAQVAALTKALADMKKDAKHWKGMYLSACQDQSRMAAQLAGVREEVRILQAQVSNANGLRQQNNELSSRLNEASNEVITLKRSLTRETAIVNKLVGC